jgi:hypothetical protein
VAQRRRVAVYIVLGGALFMAMAGHTANENWASPDFWIYLSAVREFAEHPLTPNNPVVVGTDPDPYLSPYTWVVGVVSRVTGADAVRVLAFAGLTNLVLLLVGLYRLVTTLSSRWVAPALALVFTLFAWGFPPWRWAGFFNANSIGTVLPLASTFAAALALLVLSATLRWLRSGTRGELVLVGGAIPLIITCHPFTATWTATVGLGFVVAAADRTNRRRVVAVAAAAAAAGLLALAWPFYPVAELPRASSSFDPSNAAIFSRVLPRTFLALPGLLAIWLRFRERRRDPIVLGFAAATAVFAVGWILDRPTLGRVLPAVLLMLHLALADLLAAVLDDPSTVLRRRAAIAAVAVTVVVGAAASAAGMVRAVPRALLPGGLAGRSELQSLVDRYDLLGDRIPRNDVVAVSPPLAAASAGINGNVIAPSVPAPFVDDVAERQRANRAILEPDTSPAERQDAIRRYGVGWLVLTPHDAGSLRDAGAFTDGSLLPDAETSAFVVVRVADR